MVQPHMGPAASNAIRRGQDGDGESQESKALGRLQGVNERTESEDIDEALLGGSSHDL